MPIKLSIVCTCGIQMNAPVFPSMFLFGSISQDQQTVKCPIHTKFSAGGMYLGATIIREVKKWE